MVFERTFSHTATTTYIMLPEEFMGYLGLQGGDTVSVAGDLEENNIPILAIWNTKDTVLRDKARAYSERKIRSNGAARNTGMLFFLKEHREYIAATPKSKAYLQARLGKYGRWIAVWGEYSQQLKLQNGCPQ